MVTINADLRRERERCSFNPTELTDLWDGSQEKTAHRHELGTSRPPPFFVSRPGPRRRVARPPRRTRRSPIPRRPGLVPFAASRRGECQRPSRRSPPNRAVYQLLFILTR